MNKQDEIAKMVEILKKDRICCQNCDCDLLPDKCCDEYENMASDCEALFDNYFVIESEVEKRTAKEIYYHVKRFLYDTDDNNVAIQFALFMAFIKNEYGIEV